jgi:hypothetical protein
MVVYKKIITPFLFLFSLLCLIHCLFIYNGLQVKPSEIETVELKKFYKSLVLIKNQDDIIALQNYTINKISHNSNGIDKIDIIQILKTNKGLCFHRSLIMQKVMLLNGIEVRPVFLYSNPFQKTTSIFDFFSTSILTHNVFEFNWNGKWYVMETNKVMKELKSFEEFLAKQNFFKSKPRYIRHLNNRNGRFIQPHWIPDVY